MPGPYAPTDDLVGPIVHQIALLIQAQIPSVAHVYEKFPDGPPQDNSVIIPLVSGKVVDETNGKLKLRFTFAVLHIFRRSKLPDNIGRAYTYVAPWLKLLSAWPNQNLGGLAREVDATNLMVTQRAEAAQAVVALSVNFDVVTEFNIPLS